MDKNELKAKVKNGAVKTGRFMKDHVYDIACIGIGVLAGISCVRSGAKIGYEIGYEKGRKDETNWWHDAIANMASYDDSFYGNINDAYSKTRYGNKFQWVPNKED